MELYATVADVNRSEGLVVSRRLLSYIYPIIQLLSIHLGYHFEKIPCAPLCRRLECAPIPGDIELVKTVKELTGLSCKRS